MRAIPRGIPLARRKPREARKNTRFATLARFRLLRAKQPVRQFVSGVINRRAARVGPPLPPSRRGVAMLLRIYAASSRGRYGEIVIARRSRHGSAAKSTAGRGSSKTTIADIRRNNRTSRCKGVFGSNDVAGGAPTIKISTADRREADRKSFTRANDYSVTEI